MSLWDRQQEGKDLWWKRGRGKKNLWSLSIQSSFTGQCLPLDCCTSTGWRHYRWVHQQQVWSCPGVYITNQLHFIFLICKKSLQTDFICHISLFSQIGNRYALTAAHCLYYNNDEDNNNKELLPASSFSIMLGLHNRKKTREPNRWLCRPKFRTFLFVYYYALSIRKQIRVIKVLVHENFTRAVNDIALLKLGEIKIHLVSAL